MSEIGELTAFTFETGVEAYTELIKAGNAAKGRSRSLDREPVDYDGPLQHYRIARSRVHELTVFCDSHTLVRMGKEAMRRQNEAQARVAAEIGAITQLDLEGVYEAGQ